MRFVIILLVGLSHSACIRQPADVIPNAALHLPEATPASMPLAPTYPEVDISEIESTLSIKPPLKSATPTLLINLVVHDAPVQEVLLALARESGLNIDIHPGLRGKVTLNAIQQSVPSILSRMSKQLDMYYEWANGVWSVTPDMPVIRSYKLNCVNMSRDTTGYIGVASEINSAGRAATGTGNNSASQVAMVQGGSSNSSRTAVTSQSRYHLWESIVENIQALLDETDKASHARDEVMEGTSSVLHLTSKESTPPESIQGSTLPEKPIQHEKMEQARVRWRASRLMTNPEAGILTIRASQSQQAQVRSYLESVMQVAARQVLIEATIVEVELSKSFQMGIDWSRLSASAQQRGWQFAQSLGSEAAQFNRANGSWESNNSKNALGQNNGSVAFMLSYLNPLNRSSR